MAPTGHPTDQAPHTAEMSRCDQCDTIWAPDELERCYECATCGERSLERRCEQCNRFMARADDSGCPDCAGECSEVEAVQEADGSWVLAEDYDPNETSVERSTREAAEAKERARQQRADFEGTLSARTWGDVKAGWTIPQDSPSSYDPKATWIVRHVTNNASGDVVVSLTSRHGSMEYVEVHQPGDGVRVASDELAAGQYGLVVRGPDGTDPVVHSRSRCTYEVNVGPGTSDVSSMPLLSLGARFGNLGITLGVWHDPIVAAQALDTLASVATDLAQSDGSEPSPDLEVVDVKWVRGDMQNTEPVHVALKTPAFTDEQQTPVLMVRRGNSIQQVGDGHALLAAIGAARSALDRLTMTPTSKQQRSI